MSGLTIAVDPGHGGSDPGAIGYQGTFEKDVNLAIGLYLGELLHEAGAKVIFTRDSDIYVSIFERPEIALRPVLISLCPFTPIPHPAGTARGLRLLPG